MQQPNAHVPTPDFALDGDGTARSAAFGDVYFSTRGGAAETEHVFLAGNGLPQRWLARTSFTIGELGFGTGLNFLVTWKRFVESGAPGRLQFLSIEKFPLTLEQMTAALAHQPELAPYAQLLLAAYPLRLPGLHRLHFDRVSLTLGFGDVAELLPELDATVDAWFLDGFSPAKNEAMWSPAVLRQVARLSAPDAAFATFTAAGAVKRGLREAGFTVEKVPGFANKRDMLTGYRHCERGEAIPLTAEEAGLPRSEAPRNDVVVVGGGIAGCTIARALAERGAAVTLLEKETVAAGASGNPAAVLYPQLTKYYTPATAWHFTAYGFMLRQLRAWKTQGLDFTFAQPGMLKIGKDEEDDARLRAIAGSLRLDPGIARWVERDEASSLVGQEVARGGFWFAQGSWLKPAELCRALVAHPAITLREGQAMTHDDPLWKASHVVVANAQAANDLLESKLTLGVSAGQVSLLASTKNLHGILCHKGYAVDLDGAWLIGATYDRNDLSGAVTSANHETNLAELKQALPAVGGFAVAGGRTSLRATTPGRLPYVGCVRPGLYASVGHGSRGMISAPLAAELIAAEICGEPLPLTRTLRRALAPRP